LLKNNTLKHLNLYRNIIDVDGARSLGNLLKVNTSLEFIDVGHNRIRKTGLTAICDGVLANPASKLTQLGIRSNFINDDGFTYLFEKLVFGDKKQLTQLFIKQNFLSEYHKINLAKQLDDKQVVAYVDDFCTVDYLVKQKLDKTVWVSPMPKAQFKDINGINQLFTKQECGFIADIRVASGRKVPGRSQENTYCMIEFADENSVPRALKFASKNKPSIAGMRFRIFKAGTQTAIIVPQQKRRQ
jgi:Ran GTPase-activating protein (RanGAP) involved in mRNA processing and transport